MKFITVLPQDEEEIMINLERVDAIRNIDNKYIEFKFGEGSIGIEYSRDTWNLLVDVITIAETRVQFPKPLDVKVVNK